MLRLRNGNSEMLVSLFSVAFAGFPKNLETDDHGPINTWDRVPYLQNVMDGQTVSLLVKENTITYNMIINNYRSVWPIDHDYGSCFWADSYNYLVYGGYKNYLGHDKQSLNNYYIYPDLLGHHGASMTNPTCVDSRGQTLGKGFRVLC